uniref:Synaptobrevin, longin-like domain protein n=1 Tax=Tanacetum cinerariifolium TaxID=118510 RepID=A0A699IAQ8_TANCI|nr:hypothetical protein [Tanacetum cinerariifolium]
MVSILEKSEHNVDFHLIVDFVEASPLRYALTIKPTVYVSHIRQFWFTARIETTKEGTNILATVDGILRTVTESSLRRNLKLKDEDGIRSVFPSVEVSYPYHHAVYEPQEYWVQQGEGSGTPTEPHHIPSPEAQTPLSTNPSSPTLPSVTTTPIPTITSSDTPPLRQYTTRTKIAQSLVLPPAADKPASPLRDVSQGEACPTDSSFGADQDRENIAKTSTLPMIQHQGLLPLLLMRAELEIYRLKAKVKLLEDREGVVAARSGVNALIKGRNLDEGEAAAERVSNDTKEMATVLTSIDAATILASGVAKVSTGSRSIPTAGPPAAEVPTGNDVVLTASPIFATATTTMVTPYTRRKGKETMVESETPKKKKVQEQIDAQVARELEEQMVREDQRMSKQIAMDAEIARIHTKEELQIMIDGLDRSNEIVAKEDLNQLWALVKESLSIRKPTSNKEMELWVELKRLYEPDDKGQLWTHTQNLMHAPVEWKLYDMCGVHQVTTKDKESFMLVEKDYPLRKGLAIVMIYYKLQVENYS